MRKYILVILFIFFACFRTFAQEISNSIVCPGVTHRVLNYENPRWSINLLEVDLTRANIQVESVKAKNLLWGVERTSSMSVRNNLKGHYVVGGINADFYQKGGLPINTQVIKGKILKTPNNHSIFGFYEDKTPFIEMPSYSGQIITQKGNSHSIQGINQNRDVNQLVLFNSFFGDSSKTNQFGVEIGFRILENWAVNDTFLVVTTSLDSINGNNRIDVEGGLLSGHGTSRTWLLREISLADTLKLILKLTQSKKRIREAVGGLPRIIRDGKTSIEEGGGGFATVRHPRTGVGFSKDGQKLYLFTVDGRQEGHSVGMTLYEMADFLLSIGAYQAINLDGGGSTTMIVNNTVANRPSDSTWERPVSNALLVISKDRR